MKGDNTPTARRIAARALRARQKAAIHPRYPRSIDGAGSYPEPELARPRSLDFEKRDVVDWSGYYADGGTAPDYE